MSGILLARRAARTFKAPIVLPNIGDAWLGGYYAGIIDTTRGNIIATDASQSGLRYAVILSPKSSEPSPLQYKTSADAAPAAARTLWDGLTATASMNSATYPAAQHCAGLTKPSGDDASGWYLPALDEFELVWRNLKPSTANNNTDSTTGTFPPYSHASGVNPSSDPTGAAYTTTVPSQTSVAAFKAGGAQASIGDFYWVSTEYSSSNAWIHQYNYAPGRQWFFSKTTMNAVRAIRRLVLT